METQFQEIIHCLEDYGWRIKSREIPQTSPYWWVWEFITVTKEDKKVVLTFLIDPQSSKMKQNVWAVVASEKEPNERLEAEASHFLNLKNNWQANLNGFIAGLSDL